MKYERLEENQETKVIKELSDVHFLRNFRRLSLRVFERESDVRVMVIHGVSDALFGVLVDGKVRFDLLKVAALPYFVQRLQIGDERSSVAHHTHRPTLLEHSPSLFKELSLVDPVDCLCN